MGKYIKSQGQAWAKARAEKRLRIIGRWERELKRFEKKNRPKKLRRYDKKLNQVMDAFFVIIGKVKDALNDCIPDEPKAPVPMRPLISVPPSVEQSDGLHRAVPAEKSTPEPAAEPTIPTP